MAQPVRDPHLTSTAFLAGHWLGRAGDLEIEELWLAPRGGVAEGVVRVMEGGSVHTLEFVLISVEESRVSLRFNHFNRDYTTWETDGPIELTLTTAAPNEAIFSNLSSPPRHAAEVGYRLTGPHAMTSWIVVLNDNGETARVTFDYERVN